MVETRGSSLIRRRGKTRRRCFFLFGASLLSSWPGFHWTSSMFSWTLDCTLNYSGMHRIRISMYEGYVFVCVNNYNMLLAYETEPTGYLLTIVTILLLVFHFNIVDHISIIIHLKTLFWIISSRSSVLVSSCQNHNLCLEQRINDTLHQDF